MTRALLKTDEPVAYRVVVTRTPKSKHARDLARVRRTEPGEPLVQRFGPYGTVGAARARARIELHGYRYPYEDSVAVVEAIRAAAWAEVTA